MRKKIYIVEKENGEEYYVVKINEREFIGNFESIEEAKKYIRNKDEVGCQKWYNKPEDIRGHFVSGVDMTGEGYHDRVNGVCCKNGLWKYGYWTHRDMVLYKLAEIVGPELFLKDNFKKLVMGYEELQLEEIITREVIAAGVSSNGDMYDADVEIYYHHPYTNEKIYEDTWLDALIGYLVDYIYEYNNIEMEYMDELIVGFDKIGEMKNIDINNTKLDKLLFDKVYSEIMKRKSRYERLEYFEDRGIEFISPYYQDTEVRAFVENRPRERIYVKGLNGLLNGGVYKMLLDNYLDLAILYPNDLEFEIKEYQKDICIEENSSRYLRFTVNKKIECEVLLKGRTSEEVIEELSRRIDLYLTIYDVFESLQKEYFYSGYRFDFLESSYSVDINEDVEPDELRYVDSISYIYDLSCAVAMNVQYSSDEEYLSYFKNKGIFFKNPNLNLSESYVCLEKSENYALVVDGFESKSDAIAYKILVDNFDVLKEYVPNDYNITIDKIENEIDYVMHDNGYHEVVVNNHLHYIEYVGNKEKQETLIDVAIKKFDKYVMSIELFKKAKEIRQKNK